MSLHFEELTRADARAIAPTALVVLPVGATEQHGPHLPVGTDTYAVTHIAHAAAAALPESIPVLVAPCLPFGSSHHHLPFGGTLSLSTDTYYRVLVDLVESLITDGFRRIFILNGHGGNNELIQLAARDMALQHAAHLAAASYWAIAWDALIAAEAHLHGGLPGHSGVFETSLMLALRPELVRTPPTRSGAVAGDPRPTSAYRTELHGAWQRIDGYTDNPAVAHADLGRHYLDLIVPTVTQAFTTFYHDAQAEPLV